MLFRSGAKQNHQKLIDTIALSYHDNKNFVYIYSTEMPNPINDVEIYVKSITSKFDSNDSATVLYAVKHWIMDRSYKQHHKFPATNSEWDVGEMFLRLKQVNIFAFLRMIDP